MPSPSVSAAGGTVLGRGKRVETLAGNLDVDNALIARFPSAANEIEHALRQVGLGDELGGHLVTGHVDGLAEDTESQRIGMTRLLQALGWAGEVPSPTFTLVSRTWYAITTPLAVLICTGLPSPGLRPMRSASGRPSDTTVAPVSTSMVRLALSTMVRATKWPSRRLRMRMAPCTQIDPRCR